MGRTRQIGPAFFKHERLAELSPLHRILFEGLWTIADREGRLEDRPARIKVECLPYDEGDIDAMLTDLARHRDRFIARYEVAGERYIQVAKFLKWQRPHPSETASVIPEMPANSIVEDVGSPLWTTKVLQGGAPKTPLTSSPSSPSLPPEPSLPSGRRTEHQGAPRRQGRGWRRVPADESLTEARLEFGTGAGFSAPDVAEMWEDFRDHEFAKTHIDVDATWRRWVRESKRRQGRKRSGPTPFLSAAEKRDEERRKFLGGGEA